MFDIAVCCISHSNGPPTICTSPSSQSVLAGAVTEFIVYTSGLQPLSYQWQFNGVDLTEGGRVSGSGTTTLQISAVTPEDAGTYTVVVSNIHGSVTSNPATLTVLLRPPEITSQPESQSLVSGAPASFNVAVTGSLPMAYQWRRNSADLSDGGRITGAQTATLSIAAAGIEDLGVYTVMISNGYGSVTSAAASLTVILQPPHISADPTDQSVYSGSDVGFRVTAVGSLPLSYQWRCNGVALVDEGRISGSRTANLTISGAEAQDLGLYVVEVRNAYGWTVSLPAQLTVVLAPPTITLEPQSQTVALGSTVTLQVQAAGSLPLSYRWRRDGVDVVDKGRISGANTSMLTIAGVQLGNLGSYSVAVENSLGRTESKAVSLATYSVVLQIRQDGAQVVVTWNKTGSGVVLQRARSLGRSAWEAVAESEGTNTVRLPTAETSMFFRLAQPEWPRYSLIEGSFTWHEAKADAEARGGHLVTITSPEEWTEIKAQFGAVLFSGCEPWIGATDEEREGEWTWVTGEPWDYSRWCGGGPNNCCGGEHYADIALAWPDSCPDGLWNDYPADFTLSCYVLETE